MAAAVAPDFEGTGAGAASAFSARLCRSIPARPLDHAAAGYCASTRARIDGLMFDCAMLPP